jgi:copper homeostasis protein CutC
LLKTIPQVDRILTTGGPGSWSARKLCLDEWQRIASPEITILAAVGLPVPPIDLLRCDSQIREIHVGRAARIPPEIGGQVSRIQIARLKGQPA